MNIHWIGSPHFSSRKENKIEAIIIHYTGGSSAKGTARWFRNPVSRVSAHYIISRKGAVIQCVSLTNAAWHAGRSKLPDGSKNVNQKTIGIELANRGYLIKDGDDLFYERGGDLRKYNGTYEKVDQWNEEISNLHPIYTVYWEPYSVVQIESLISLLEYLKEDSKMVRKDFKYILGHEEICIPEGRKQDPGLLFPWEQIRF